MMKMDPLIYTKGTLLVLTTSLLFGKHGARDVMFLDNGCPRPASISRGNFRLATDNYHVTYECDVGFTLIGEAKSTCNGNYWDKDPPSCIARGCKQLKAIPNGYIELDYGGSLANFRCEDDFRLEGPSVLACDGREWNGTQPSCIDIYGRNTHKKTKLSSDDPTQQSHNQMLQNADYTCIGKHHHVAPPRIINAIPSTKYETYEGTPRLYTIYRCKWGFVTIGDQTGYLYCRDREWVGSKPKCVAKVDSTQNSLYSNDAAHYQRDHPIPDHRSSHEEWLQYADYTCFTTSRSVTAPDVSHARTIPRYSAIGGSPHLYVEYKCNEGYKVKTRSRYMYCKDKAWLGDHPQCHWDATPDRKAKNDRAGSLPKTDHNYGSNSHSSSTYQINSHEGRHHYDSRNTETNYGHDSRTSQRNNYATSRNTDYDSRNNQGVERDIHDKTRRTDSSHRSTNIRNREQRRKNRRQNRNRENRRKNRYRFNFDRLSDVTKPPPKSTYYQTKDKPDVLEGFSDPCEKDNGGCHQMCIDANGRPQCSCMRGYTLHHDNKSCTDINECKFNNGGCDHTCMNTRGSYKCSCDQNYELHHDGHTCVRHAHKGDGHEVPPMVLFHA